MSEYFGSIYEDGRKKQKVDSYKNVCRYILYGKLYGSRKRGREVDSEFRTFLVPCEQKQTWAQEHVHALLGVGD